jgi:hypothetical protein
MGDSGMGFHSQAIRGQTERRRSRRDRDGGAAVRKIPNMLVSEAGYGCGCCVLLGYKIDRILYNTAPLRIEYLRVVAFA